MAEEKSLLEKAKEQIERLTNRVKDLELDNILFGNRIKSLEYEKTELKSDLKQASNEAEILRKQVVGLTEKAFIGQAMKEEGERQLILAKCSLSFLFNQNQEGLSFLIRRLGEKDRENVLRDLKHISTLFSQAKTDFEKYNKNYIKYVQGLTWWERIWYNHGESGINRAYRSYHQMMQQFEGIQRECNDKLTELIKSNDYTSEAVSQLYKDVKHRLIFVAEQQLVEMRRNFFDSSNLNPFSYATYLIQYIFQLKEEKSLEQKDSLIIEKKDSLKVIVEKGDAYYQPLFTKEQIKPLYEQYKNEYESHFAKINKCG